MRMTGALRVFRAATVALFAAAALWAQLAHSTASVRGNLSGGNEYLPDLTVQLVSGLDHTIVDRAPASVTGDFEFSNVAPGDYQVQVVDRSGNILCNQYARLTDITDYVTLHLPERRSEQQPASGEVSLAELSHKVPKKAAKEFDKALKATRDNDSQAAITHLQKALQIDPAYLQAYNNLGVRYLQLGEHRKALEQFQKAYELAPTSPIILSNLALADYLLNRYPEAEKAAREAVHRDAASSRARYLLGLSLTALGRNLEEALGYLHEAEREFPKAHLASAQILARLGQAARAVAELRQYLTSGKVEHRAQLEAWLQQLQQAGAVAGNNGLGASR